MVGLDVKEYRLVASYTALIGGMSYLFMAALIPFESDSELIARLKRRDPGAMGDLYDRFGKPAFALIAQMVKDRAVAEDLLAETFMKAWNRINGFQSGHPLLGLWILSMARNRALDYLRTHGEGFGHTIQAVDALEQPQLFQEVRPGEHCHDPLPDMQQGFGQLEENERQVLELAYFGGLNLNEIGTRMGQPVSLVKSWTETAIEKLRTQANITISPKKVS